MRRNSAVGATIVGIVLILVLITIITASRIVGTGQVGVVTKLGEVTGRELDEGFSFVAPLGMNSVTRYDVKTQKTDIETGAATKDLQDVNSTLVLNYRLNRGDVSKIHQEVGRNYEDKIIIPVVNEVFKAETAKYTATEMITKRAAMKNGVSDEIQNRLKERGIFIEDVNIINLTFSEEFNKAVEAVQIANRRIEQARQELETTKIEADKKIAEAEGAAEAQRVQQETLTQEMLQKQAIESWDGKLPLYYGGEGMIFNLPVKD